MNKVDALIPVFFESVTEEAKETLEKYELWQNSKNPDGDEEEEDPQDKEPVMYDGDIIEKPEMTKETENYFDNNTEEDLVSTIMGFKEGVEARHKSLVDLNDLSLTI